MFQLFVRNSQAQRIDEKTVDIDFIFMLRQSTLVIKVVMFLLLLLSVSSWSLIFFKYFQFSRLRRKIKKDNSTFAEIVKLGSALSVLKNDPLSPVSRVARSTIRELHALQSLSPGLEKTDLVINEIVRAQEETIQEIIDTLYGTLSFLATCAHIAPFLGLFGTVWGIMHSFSAISRMKTAPIAAVAPGLSEALITTAFGLAIAIPAVLAYHGLLKILNDTERDLRSFSKNLLRRIKKEYPAFSPRNLAGKNKDSAAEGPTRTRPKS